MSKIVITIEVPEGTVPDVQYVSSEPQQLPPFPGYDRDERVAPAVTPASPICDHGPRYFKEGTNKNGKPYKGWFCKDDVCKPVWT